ncbi:outer membrane protein YejO [Escherichia coli]|uniref:Outer membrane protein YejO n=1 Tax=Escherichia coli TaxID=562 RepID=A0A485JCN7_ECOLX|nr:outer membrane protein YejO [Escherichia coli]
MHQSGSVSLCRSAISVLVATALYSPIALASTVEYGETVDGVVLEKDIQLVYGPPIIRKSILAENSILKNLV